MISGINGNIGSFLHPQLEHEFSIMAMSYSQGSIENNFIQLDLTDIDKVNHYAENCDHFDDLIFLVGLAHIKGKGRNLPEFKKVNYQTLLNLLSLIDTPTSGSIKIRDQKINFSDKTFIGIDDVLDDTIELNFLSLNIFS